ncbi:baseplate J/gp47 family protein [Rhizobium rhizoryzae]|uniref:Phage-related baseplate assembly protein n=1 Tax=Rhizobium rhizoryzae TaxID=451876 RepID=A0A7W6PUG2_9HYPH|nr:baseplate J/gp47 family protein [Rhizobium rhizoryzae]MBB4145815.1 phage-related baseplate assembly protein [Rhizobium rhizoryzae]
MTYAPTAIDLSRLPAPQAIEIISLNQLQADFKARFLLEWAAQQQLDPTLEDFTEADLETHPAIVVARAWRYLRNLDRNRVNDGLKALLAPLASGANLDAVAASRNVERLIVQPATSTAEEILESDTSLLQRFLESFDRPAAGSAGRYLYDARSAWPQSADKTLGLWDARVNGYAVHGRRGDIDLVIAGPFGRVPTTPELLTVRDAVTDINRAPEGVSIVVLPAVRVEYQPSLVIEVPGNGPAPETIRQEALARVEAAAMDRRLIGGEIPAGLLAGSAYGPNVIKVRDLAPVVIAPDPYKIPVMTGLTVTVEVRG